LVVAVGRATRLLRYVLDLEKHYECELVLGRATSTLDDTGETVARAEMGAVTYEQVVDAAANFVGTIEQIPPMVSALKVNGRRLHELAREGIEVERAPRRVEIYRLEVTPSRAPNCFHLALACSSGTYVRTLAADIGEALGGVAHLRELRRTAVGSFVGDEAVALDEVSPSALRPARELVGHLRDAEVDADQVDDIATGKILARRALSLTGDGPWALVDAEGDLLAVYEAYSDERAKPAVVLVERGRASATR
jgi:tRNA pseudouridine55 synthase